MLMHGRDGGHGCEATRVHTLDGVQDEPRVPLYKGALTARPPHQIVTNLRQ